MKDDRVKALERALDLQRARKLLRRTCDSDLWRIDRVVSIDLVKYRPRRRATIRYAVEATRAGQPRRTHWLFGKAYRGHGGARVYEALRGIQSRLPDRLRVPQPLGYHDRYRFLLTDALEGVPLSDLLTLPDGRRLLADFGHRLARLHGYAATQAPPQPDGPATVPTGPNWMPARVHSAREEVAVLNRALVRASGADRLSADLRLRHAELHTRICEALMTAGADERRSPGILHRDLYPDQVLACGDGFGLVDLDEVAQGEAEIDVGNFIAHLLLRDLQLMATLGPALEQARAFCSGYARARELSAVRLRTYTAGALLRLASLERISLSGISLLPWPQLSGALLEQSMRFLDQPWPFRCGGTTAGGQSPAQGEA